MDILPPTNTPLTCTLSPLRAHRWRRIARRLADPAALLRCLALMTLASARPLAQHAQVAAVPTSLRGGHHVVTLKPGVLVVTPFAVTISPAAGGFPVPAVFRPVDLGVAFTVSARLLPGHRSALACRRASASRVAMASEL